MFSSIIFNLYDVTEHKESFNFTFKRKKFVQYKIMMVTSQFLEIFNQWFDILLIIIIVIHCLTYNCLFNPNLLWCNHKLPNRDLYQNCKKNSQDRQLCCFNSVSFYSISELIVTTVNDCPETSIENEQQLKPQNNVINSNHLLLNKYMYVKQVYIVRRKKSLKNYYNWDVISSSADV